MTSGRCISISVSRPWVLSLKTRVFTALIHGLNTNYCCAECVKCMYDRDINNAVEFVRFSLAIRFFNLYRARQICCR
ncbi:putative DNA-binding helix-hairpin-helix protein [Spongiibacter marinus]|nr:putative DNA-binding helix-hairpin-helix protein [Spongiibacter marinus]